MNSGTRPDGSARRPATLGVAHADQASVEVHVAAVQAKQLPSGATQAAILTIPQTHS